MEERYKGFQTALNIKDGLQDVEDVGEGLAQHKVETEGAGGPAGHRPMGWPLWSRGSEGRVPPAALRIPTSRAHSGAVQLCKTGPIAADRLMKEVWGGVR